MWAVVAVWVCAVEGYAADEIRAPFGFQWGDSVARIEQTLVNAKAKIVAKEAVPGGTLMKVTGITQKLLQFAYFKFQGDSLVEIEVQYGDSAWSVAQFNDFFDQTRRSIDARYGMGQLIARSKSVQNGISSAVTGYQWMQVGATLQLFFFTAESGADTVRVLSLHYRSSS